MKTRIFILDASHLPLASPTPAAGPQSFDVPGLNAYAVAHGNLYFNGQTVAIDGDELKIVNDTLRSKSTQFCREDTFLISIYYYGIRNYSFLFPQVKSVDSVRAERMGKFYEEAENAFDSGAWLSYMLMCGSIFEHLLFFKLSCPANTKSLQDLTKKALAQQIITISESIIIDNTRRTRNVIHCNKLSEPYITRAEAMDARVLIENLIMKL